MNFSIKFTRGVKRNAMTKPSTTGDKIIKIFPMASFTLLKLNIRKPKMIIAQAVRKTVSPQLKYFEPFIFKVISSDSI